MEKGLGITKNMKTQPISEDEIKSQISSDSVEIVEAVIKSVFDKRNDLNQRITELNATRKNLELLSDIPIDLELYSGYRSIFSTVGTVAEDPTSALSGVDCEVFSSFDKKKGNVVAVFAKVSDKDKVQSILSDYGFVPRLPPSPGRTARSRPRRRISRMSRKSWRAFLTNTRTSSALRTKSFPSRSRRERSL